MTDPTTEDKNSKLKHALTQQVLLRNCTEYARKHGRVMSQVFLDEIADNLSYLTKEVERLVKLLEETGDERDTLQWKVDQLAHKTCQAYQVIGCLGLLDEEDGPLNEKEVVRAMDYFADDKLFSEEFLPFNPFSKDIALAGSQNKEIIQGEVGKEILPISLKDEIKIGDSVEVFMPSGDTHHWQTFICIGYRNGRLMIELPEGVIQIIPEYYKRRKIEDE